MRRGWLAAGVALVLVLTGVGLGVAWREGERPCGSSVVSRGADDSESPLAAGDAPTELLSALEPVGEVLASVGYDYEPVQLSAYPSGVGVRVVDDPAFTMLDDVTGAPRWSVAVGTPQSTFDADAERYVVVTLPTDSGPEVVSLDLATGERVWCSSLASAPVAGAWISTALQPDGSVVALLVGDDGQQLTRISEDGVRWQSTPVAGDDHLGPLDDDRMVLGGSSLPDLLDGTALAQRAAGTRVLAVDTADGAVAWELEEAAGTDVHVVGVDQEAGRVVLQRVVAGEAQPTLVALDAEGEEVWSTTPSRGTAFDATVRGGRVVVRAGQTWSAYDVNEGRRVWGFEVAESPQFLPYGATLDSMSSLDADRVLIGATQALVTLDLRTGRQSSTPLPTDGVATTYWPQRVVVSPGLLGVVTNTGAAILRR